MFLFSRVSLDYYLDLVLQGTNKVKWTGKLSPVAVSCNTAKPPMVKKRNRMKDLHPFDLIYNMVVSVPPTPLQVDLYSVRETLKSKT